MKKYLLLVPAIWLLTACCQPEHADQQQKEVVVTVDSAWMQFFARNCCGVTGSDGYYSVPLPDGRTVWIYGDSFLGTVNEDGSREKRSPLFIRNAFNVQDGDSLHSLYQVIDGWESSEVIPPDAVKGSLFSEDSLWFWPGDGLVENGQLKVFMSSFYQADTGNWGFAWTGANIATFDLPEMNMTDLHHFDYPGPVEVHWGHAICDEAPDYTYIYGAGDHFPYVARVPKGDVLQPWAFWNGSEWVRDSRESRPMVDMKGSEQFSVFKLGEQYVYMTQMGDFLQSSLYAFTSSTPYGPWSEPVELAPIKPLQADATNLFAYNPVVHPHLTRDNQLLVSYCVNSFELEDLFEDAGKYRPVFLRVPISLIIDEKE